MASRLTATEVEDSLSYHPVGAEARVEAHIEARDRKLEHRSECRFIRDRIPGHVEASGDADTMMGATQHPDIPVEFWWCDGKPSQLKLGTNAIEGDPMRAARNGEKMSPSEFRSLVFMARDVGWYTP